MTSYYVRFRQKTIAVITRIRDDDNANGFTATAYDKNHKPLLFRVNNEGKFCIHIETDKNGEKHKNFIPDSQGKPFKNISIDAEGIDILNNAIDPTDPDKKRALVHEIEIVGQIPAIPSNKINIVFVDTPGGNNAQNEIHHEVMERAIKDENKSLILYVFDGTHASANDSNEILQDIANVMKKSKNGKQARDRILFVANKMDNFNTQKESFPHLINNTLLPMLNRHGITDPNLYLVSAEGARLCRLKKNRARITRDEVADLSKMLLKMGCGFEDYRLYKHSTISQQSKNRFDEQINQLMQANPEAVDETYGTGLSEIAEICSGIPALEAAICEYIEKYAICIKVKDAHDAFMRKVEERNMLDSCKKKWASSDQEFQKVRTELEQKEREYMRNNKLAEYRDRINKIHLDDKPLRDLSLNYTKMSNALQQKYKEKTKLLKDRAIAEIAIIRNSMKSDIQELCDTFLMQCEEYISKECNNILVEYNTYAANLKADGLLNLGGIDLTKLTAFPVIDYETLDRDDLSQYTSSEMIVTGSHIVKKKGFWNWLKRVFGSEDGWESVYDYSKVEYINLDEYITTILSTVYKSLEKEARNIYNNAINDVNIQKSKVSKQLETIDYAIRQTLSVIK